MNTVAPHVTNDLHDVLTELAALPAKLEKLTLVVCLDSMLNLVASEKRSTKYSPVATALGMAPGLAKFSRALGLKMEADQKRGWPLFCSLVVSQESDRPGRGFFEQAKALGHTFVDEDLFLKEQQEACFAHMAAVKSGHVAKAHGSGGGSKP